MPILFRIIDIDTPLYSKAAKLNARELAALRLILQSNGHHARLDDGELDGTAFNLEFNANAVPVAVFARAFRERDDVLAIIEEAQFLGRAIRVSRAPDDEQPSLTVSSHIALSPPIVVTREQADAVLECLGIDASTEGCISLTSVRESLHQAMTSHRFDKRRLTHLFDYLVRLADTDCGEQQPQLVWA